MCRRCRGLKYNKPLCSQFNNTYLSPIHANRLHLTLSSTIRAINPIRITRFKQTIRLFIFVCRGLILKLHYPSHQTSYLFPQITAITVHLRNCHFLTFRESLLLLKIISSINKPIYKYLIWSQFLTSHQPLYGSKMTNSLLINQLL